MTDQEKLDANIERIITGALSAWKVLGAIVGLVLTLAALTPVVLLAVIAWVLQWTTFPGFHRLGHSIARHVTTPVLDLLIGGAERAQAWAIKRGV